MGTHLDQHVAAVIDQAGRCWTPGRSPPRPAAMSPWSPGPNTLRHYQAASQPKELRWYDAGHFLNCTASKDMMAWLARHIRIDPRRYRCTP